MSEYAYKPSVSLQKGAVEGGIAGSVGLILATAVTVLRGNGVDLPFTPESDTIVIGTLTGVITGAIRSIRNWRKKRKAANCE